MTKKQAKYSVIDLFAGVGGISLGLKWAGFNTIFANEFDQEIGTTFKKNFPDHDVIIEDIRKLTDLNQLSEKYGLKSGELDLIVGGPPCQGFSMANRKRIEDDPRNLLFLEFVRFVEHFQPKCFLIENVMGMKSENVSISDKPNQVSDSMSSYFNDIGFQIGFRSFRSEEHGVPQIRRRVMVIGTRLEEKKAKLKYGEIGNLEKKYLSKEELNGSLSKLESELTLFEETYDFPRPDSVIDALSDLPPLLSGQNEDEMDYLMKAGNDYQKFMRVNSKKVYNHSATPHSESVLHRILQIKPGQNFQDLPLELRTKSHHSGAWGRLLPNGLSPTITTRFDTPSTGRVIHPYQDRTLTVREAARIQSFPDDFIFYGTRTSQGKQVGNAVPPLVAKSIGEMFIKDFLLK